MLKHRTIGLVNWHTAVSVSAHTHSCSDYFWFSDLNIISLPKSQTTKCSQSIHFFLLVTQRSDCSHFNVISLVVMRVPPGLYIVWPHDTQSLLPFCLSAFIVHSHCCTVCNTDNLRRRSGQTNTLAWSWLWADNTAVYCGSPLIKCYDSLAKALLWNMFLKTAAFRTKKKNNSCLLHWLVRSFLFWI